MTPIKPNIDPTGRYTTSQAAAVLCVHRNTLLNWVNSGKLTCLLSHTGRRVYLGRELMRLWRWYH